MPLFKIISLQELLGQWNNLQSIPIGIPLIDECLGGIFNSCMHIVYGEPGTGKTWFCFRIIKYLWKFNNNARILYIDFDSHLRPSNFDKICSNTQQLEKIDFFKPKDLTEQIIFFKNLLDNSDFLYDIVILDTIFGSPLHTLKALKYDRRRIIDHLTDLQELACAKEVPIIIVNHVTFGNKNSDPSSALTQQASDFFEQFIPITFTIIKTENKHILQLEFFKKYIGEEKFELIP